MAMLTGGEALAKQLAREGVRVVFGLPGVQLYGAMAGLRDEPAIQFITTRHEQATTYMADGYARASGDFGVALVVPGPGLLNASAGLSTAFASSSPVLIVAGQVPRDQLGRDVGLLHEVNDQLEAIRPVTKWQRRALRASDIPAAVREAVRQLKSNRPRPVEIEIPPEGLEEEAEITLLEPAPVERAAPDPNAVDRVATMLLNAKRVVIYAGGGVHLSGAHDTLREIAERLQAGVVESAEGRGAISSRHPLYLGAAVYPGTPLHDYLAEADVILAVGTRLANVTFSSCQRVVQIDVDPNVVGRTHRDAIPLVGDAVATLDALANACGTGAGPDADFTALKERTQAVAAETQPQGAILSKLRESCPDDTIVVAGMTQLGYYSRMFWPVYEPRTYLTSSYSGNLGFAWPTALGAKVARPDRPVLAISGDGGFLYNSQEFATAVQHDIPAVAVVFNDNAYGNVARDLDMNWGGAFAADLRNPDFMKLADAYGAAGFRAEDPLDVGRLVAQAIDSGRPALVEVPVERMPRPLFFSPRKTLPKYASRGSS